MSVSAETCSIIPEGVPDPPGIEKDNPVRNRRNVALAFGGVLLVTGIVIAVVASNGTAAPLVVSKIMAGAGTAGAGAVAVGLNSNNQKTGVDNSSASWNGLVEENQDDSAPAAPAAAAPAPPAPPAPPALPALPAAEEEVGSWSEPAVCQDEVEEARVLARALVHCDQTHPEFRSRTNSSTQETPPEFRSLTNYSTQETNSSTQYSAVTEATLSPSTQHREIGIGRPPKPLGFLGSRNQHPDCRAVCDELEAGTRTVIDCYEDTGNSQLATSLFDPRRQC